MTTFRKNCERKNRAKNMYNYICKMLILEFYAKIKEVTPLTECKSISEGHTNS